MLVIFQESDKVIGLIYPKPVEYLIIIVVVSAHCLNHQRYISHYYHHHTKQKNFEKKILKIKDYFLTNPQLESLISTTL